MPTFCDIRSLSRLRAWAVDLVAKSGNATFLRDASESDFQLPDASLFANFMVCVADTASMALWDTVSRTEITDQCPWSCDGCNTNNNNNWVSGESWRPFRTEEDARRLAAQLGLEMPGSSSKVQPDFTRHLQVQPDFIRRLQGQQPQCEASCQADPCCGTDPTRCCRARPVTYQREEPVSADPDITVRRCGANAAKAQTAIRAAAEDIANVFSSGQSRRGCGVTESRFMDQSVLVRAAMTTCVTELTKSFARGNQEAVRACSAPSDCYARYDGAAKVNAQCLLTPTGRRRCNYDDPALYLFDCLQSRLDQEQLQSLKVALNPAGTQDSDVSAALANTVRQNVCAGAPWLDKEADCTSAKICNWNNWSLPTTVESVCLAAPAGAEGSSATFFCAGPGNVDLGIRNSTYRNETGCTGGVCSDGSSTTEAACLAKLNCSGSCAASGVAGDGCAAGGTFSADTCRGFGSCSQGSSRWVAASACSATPFCPRLGVNASECAACGLNTLPMSNFLRNEVVSAVWTPFQWRRREMVPRNRWTPGISPNAIEMLRGKMYQLAMRSDMLTMVACSVSPVLAAVHKVQCLCGSPNAQECATVSDERLIMDVTVPPGSTRPINMGDRGTLNVSASAAQPTKITLAFVPAELYRNENATSDLEAALLNTKDRAAKQRDLKTLISSMSRIMQATSPQSNAMMVRSSCGYDVVKNVAGATVAQLASDGVSLGISQTDAAVVVCLQLSQTISLDPCKYSCGGDPVFALLQNGVLREQSIAVENRSSSGFCGTVRTTGTYFLAFKARANCTRTESCPVCVANPLLRAANSAPAVTVTTVTGSLRLTVANPTTFINNPDAKRGVAAGIANVTGVPPSYVDVTLTAARRLAEARQLQSSVQVAYTINIPSNAPATVSSITNVTNALKATAPDVFTTQIAAGLQQTMGNSAPNVTVTAVVAPVVATTTSTTTVTTAKSAYISAAPRLSALGALGALAAALAAALA